MKENRLRHLLKFEWQRLRWIILATWFFLLFAFVPRFMSAVGWWKSSWHDTEEFFAGVGLVGFGIGGLAISSWSGFLESRTYATRPLKRGEIRFIGLAVLFTVLVFPVLMLTLLSLWLQDFSSAIIWKNFLSVAAAIIPIWLAIRTFAKLAGTVPTLAAGLAAIGAAFVIGELFNWPNLIFSWTNVLGQWSGSHFSVATWVTVLFLFIAGWFFRSKGPASKIVAAVLCFCLGGLFLKPTQERLEAAQFQKSIDLEIDWTGKSRSWKTTDGSQTDLYYDDHFSGKSRFQAWVFAGNDPYDPGLKKKAKAIAQRSLLPDQILFRGQVDRDTKLIDKELDSQSASFLRVPSEPRPEGETSIPVIGALCEVEQLVDVPLGQEIAITDSKFQGLIKNPSRKPPNYETSVDLILNLPAHEGIQRNGERIFPVDDWIVHLHYPITGMVLEGRPNSSGRDFQIGGVSKIRLSFEFPTQFVQAVAPEAVLEHPRLQIYRVNFLETGKKDVELPDTKVTPPERSQRGYDYLALRAGAQFVTAYPGKLTKLRSWRPNPRTAGREEVGAYLRAVDGLRSYEASGEDLAEFADEWGDLMIAHGRIPPHVGFWNEKSSFLNGATEEWRDELANSLGEVRWAPEVLVKRGWTGSAREQVELLLAEKDPRPNIFRLAAYLGHENLEGPLKERLLSGVDEELYEIARTYPGIEKDIDEILDARLARVDQRMRLQWSDLRRRSHFQAGWWRETLKQGREKDLESFLTWMKQFLDAGANVSAPENLNGVLEANREFKLLARANKLEPEFFDWDPVLRKWIFNEENH